MSDSSIDDRIDTGELVSSVDYEDLFEGTDLEPDLDFDDEGKSTAETVGGAIGAYVGRRLGEMVAREIADVARDAVGRGEEAEERESETDEEESESQADEDEEESETEADEGEEESEGEAEEGEEESETEAEDGQGEEESESEGEESPEVESIPESADELADLSYRQLQSLAKERDIQANLSREELTQELSETLGIEE